MPKSAFNKPRQEKPLMWSLLTSEMCLSLSAVVSEAFFEKNETIFGDFVSEVWSFDVPDDVAISGSSVSVFWSFVVDGSWTNSSPDSDTFD